MHSLVSLCGTVCKCINTGTSQVACNIRDFHWPTGGGMKMLLEPPVQNFVVLVIRRLIFLNAMYLSSKPGFHRRRFGRGVH